MDVFLQVFFGSVFVVLLLYGTLWLLNVLMRGKMGASNLEVVEVLAVGRRAQVVLMRVGEQHYLIGVSDQSTQLIKELPEEFAVRNREPLKQRGGSTTFQDIFMNLAGHKDVIEK